jgi:arylsulfatase
MRPNIIVITCDQLKKDALGCYGNSVIETPNIDIVAENGVRFEQMFVANPLCAPNRAAIATGRYPTVCGMLDNGCILPTEEETLMECLRNAGYGTYGIGKMHFKPQWTLKIPDEEYASRYKGGVGAVNPQPYPWEFPFYGFEKGYFTEDNRVGPYEDYLKEKGQSAWDDPHSWNYGQHVTVTSAWSEENHQTTWVADRAIEFINTHDTLKPLFMWISFIHPHSPFNPPAPYDSMYSPDEMPPSKKCENEIEGWPELYKEDYFSKEGHHGGVSYSEFSDYDWKKIKAFYYGMISLIDKQVGKIIDSLAQRGILDKTIIVFTSDHGEMMGDHHMLLKGAHYDSATNVPFIISGYHKTKNGKTNNVLCQSIDIMPTLLELAEVTIPEGVQGKSMLGVLDGNCKKLYDTVFIESSSMLRTVRTSYAQLTWHGPGKKGELYDLTSDPNCFCNLWDKPETAELQGEMIERLIECLICNTDPKRKRRALC